MLGAFYASAVLIMAGLAIASYCLFSYTISYHQRAETVLITSARQRFLTEEILALAAAYRRGQVAPQAQFLAAVNDFTSNETTLENEQSGLFEARSRPGPQRPSLAALHAQALAFSAGAARLATLPAASPAANALLVALTQQSGPALVAALTNLTAADEIQEHDFSSQLRLLNFMILGLLGCTFAFEALVIIRPFVERINTYTAEILRQATTDPLTGLWNRRGFLERSEIEHVRATRYRRPLSLMVLDADHFKRVNDTHGHAAGDLVLKALAESFRQILRETDVIGRLGGEEFAVLMPETDLPGAQYVAERLRMRVAKLPVKYRDRVIQVTVSVGVAEVENQEGGFDQAMALADARMYRAKQGGRNCIMAGEALAS